MNTTRKQRYQEREALRKGAEEKINKEFFANKRKSESERQKLINQKK